MNVRDNISMFSRRYTEVPHQPHHLLLVGGEPGEHKLRRDVQPARHHVVEARALHHLRGGNGQHAGAQRGGQVRAGGESRICLSVVSFTSNYRPSAEM